MIGFHTNIKEGVHDRLSHKHQGRGSMIGSHTNIKEGGYCHYQSGGGDDQLQFGPNTHAHTNMTKTISFSSHKKIQIGSKHTYCP
jgi:hypothetical protein